MRLLKCPVEKGNFSLPCICRDGVAKDQSVHIYRYIHYTVYNAIVCRKHAEAEADSVTQSQ